MGEMRTPRYIAKATTDGHQIRFVLTDRKAKQQVAEGTGPTVFAAQQDARGRATSEDATRHLTQSKYPASLADLPPCPDPECEGDLELQGSSGSGGAYRPGDTFDLELTVHHYKCRACGRTFLQSDGGAFLETFPER